MLLGLASVAREDGYVSYTATGTRRPSHHQIVYVGGSWHTTICLSKTLKEHSQEKAGHAEEHPKGKTLTETPKEKKLKEHPEELCWAGHARV